MEASSTPLLCGLDHRGHRRTSWNAETVSRSERGDGARRQAGSVFRRFDARGLDQPDDPAHAARRKVRAVPASGRRRLDLRRPRAKATRLGMWKSPTGTASGSPIAAPVTSAAVHGPTPGSLVRNEAAVSHEPSRSASSRSARAAARRIVSARFRSTPSGWYS